MRRNINNMSGFTLIEILVSVAILVILASGFLGIQYIFSQNQVGAWKEYSNIEDTNQIVSNFIKETRDARQSETGSYLLVSASDQEIIFFSDYDYDNVVERIRYTLTQTNLIKGVIEPAGSPATYQLASEKTKTLSTYIRNSTSPLFYYYNKDWPEDKVNNPLPLAQRIADTKIVKISLIINKKANDPGSNFSLDSQSTIRMLKID